jgi:uncharacterized damage-inducible protein DinB
MQKDIFVLFAKYNKTANQKMNEVIKTLSKEEWDKNLGGFFNSVRGICSHLYICDFNWLKRFSRLRDFDVFKEAFFAKESYSFKEKLFPEMDEYLTSRPLLDERIIAFVNEIDEKDLNSVLKYSDSEGNTYERNFGGLIMHSLNHDTHHRGMISLYLEMLGRENDFASFNTVL